MIPVMMISGLLGLKKYHSKDFISALAISFGCVLFVVGGDTAPQQWQASDSLYGVLLIFGYLFFDGFTSTFQEKLFKDYNISSYNQMLYVNGTSAVLSLTYLLVENQLSDAIDFTFRYPSSYIAAFSLSLAACAGQLVIYYIIKNFGALVFATAMVFRHIVAILLSCLLFFHPLTLYQWLAGGIVIGVYYMHSISKRKSHGPETTTIPAPSVTIEMDEKGKEEVEVPIEAPK